METDKLKMILRDCERRLRSGWRCRHVDDLDAEEKLVAARWEKDLKIFMGLVERELLRKETSHA